MAIFAQERCDWKLCSSSEGAVWAPNIGQTRTFYASRVLEYEQRHIDCVRQRMAAVARLNQAQSESKPKSLLKRLQDTRSPAHRKVRLMHINPEQKRQKRGHASAPVGQQLCKGSCRESGR